MSRSAPPPSQSRPVIGRCGQRRATGPVLSLDDLKYLTVIGRKVAITLGCAVYLWQNCDLMCLQDTGLPQT